MTECRRESAGRKGRKRVRREPKYEQVAFSFGGSVKPTLRCDAEAVTSDVGLLPLRELDERLGLVVAAAECIEDLRRPEMVVHPLVRLLRETVYAYAAGYEDANDHGPLNSDELFRHLIGPINTASVNPKKHEGTASEATISRLLGGRKLIWEAFNEVHRKWFLLAMRGRAPRVLTLDVDGYDVETHGGQQLTLFNGYYGQEMYYPLKVSVAEWGMILGNILRPGDSGANTGAEELLRPTIEFLKLHFPKTRLRLRADSGFMNGRLYRLCEEFGIEYAIRLRLNKTLKGLIERLLVPGIEREIPPARRNQRWSLYRETTYRAGSWKRERRIIMKITHNPSKPSEKQLERYVLVTNSRRSIRNVWNFYGHRGQCEQRIDELKNHLRADKLSCTLFDRNDFKLHLFVMAHNLYAVARICLPPEHQLKRATIARMRICLVKCGATVRRTSRRLWLHASRNWPYRDLLLDLSRRFASGRLTPMPIWDTG